MDVMESAEVSELHNQLAQLKEESAEQEQKLMQAAQYGKTLLEENADLRRHIDQIMQQHAAILEEKQQEICSLNYRLETASCTEKWQQEEMAVLRLEVNSVREQMEEERNQELAKHKKQENSLRQDLSHLQSVEQGLRKQVAEMEALLESHLDRTMTHNISSASASFACSSEEMAALMEEMNTLKMDLTEAQAKTIDLSGKLEGCQREKEALVNRLKNADEEVEDLQSQVVSCCKHLEESRKETLELRAQLDASRADNQEHNAKGNSIFAEVEDRRVVVEKKMAALKIQNEQLKEKYNIEKELNTKYKMQINMNLQWASQRNDLTEKRLVNHLGDANAEIRTLTAKLQQLEKEKEDTMWEKISSLGLDEFFMVTFQMEQEKLNKVQVELHGKRLQCGDLRQQHAQLLVEKRNLLEEQDKLRRQLLMAKDQADKVQDSKLQKPVVEKVDMGNSQLLTTSSRPPLTQTAQPASGQLPTIIPLSCTPSTLLARPTGLTRTGTMGTGGVLKPTNVSNYGPTGVLKDVLPETDMQKENRADPRLDWKQGSVSGNKRSVKMAEDVRVVDAEGEKSTMSLAQEKNTAESLKTEASKKKEGKTSKPVKFIDMRDSPELDCKTQ